MLKFAYLFLQLHIATRCSVLFHIAVHTLLSVL